jgi:hypothetical protein
MRKKMREYLAAHYAAAMEPAGAVGSGGTVTDKEAEQIRKADEAPAASPPSPRPSGCTGTSTSTAWSTPTT